MDNIFRPSQAFPAPCETVSALHDFVTEGIAKELEKIAVETWSKFNGVRATPEQEQAYFRKVYEAKAVELAPRRVIQSLEIVAIRKE